MKKKYYYKQDNNKRWGLIDNHGNWVIDPIYSESEFDEFDEEYFKIPFFIFKHEGLFYIFNHSLKNVYPDGVIDYEDLSYKCNMSHTDEDSDYFIKVKGKKNLYGACFQFTTSFDNKTIVIEDIIEPLWELLYDIDSWSFITIKGEIQKFYYINNGCLQIFDLNLNQKVKPEIFYNFIKKHPTVELPLCHATMSNVRFYIVADYCRAVLMNNENEVPDFSPILEWIKPFYKNDNMIGLFDWIFLKLFAENFDGIKIPKKYKDH